MPVYANYTAKPYDFSRPAMEVVPEMLHKQMSNPVIWEDTMKNMIADGIEIFVEVGAGKTLSNLLKKKIAPEAVIYQVDNAETLAATKAALLGE